MAFSCAETIYVHAEPMKDPTRNGRESVLGERSYVSPTYIIDTLKAREHSIGYTHDQIAHLLIAAALYF